MQTLDLWASLDLVLLYQHNGNIPQYIQMGKNNPPSVYKKAIQLEEKGFIKGNVVKEGKMPEKAVYSLTDSGNKEFERLMLEIPETGMAVLRQQYVLAEAIEKWIVSLKKDFPPNNK